jgi:hypothetical protein
MVVSSAIQDHGFRPARYFMFNAAVPAEAFDASAWDDTPLFNPMVHEEWINYDPCTWAANWYELFQTPDSRNSLTWKQRFGVVSGCTELHNYYSSGDEVLALYTGANADGAIPVDSFTGGAARNHSWQKQERFKGRSYDIPSGWAGTSEMGWGFSIVGTWVDGTPPMYNPLYVGYIFLSDHVRTNLYTFAQANAATANQLRSDPVFSQNPLWLLTANSLLRWELDWLLAAGIPALSGPAGSRPLEGILDIENNNMNTVADTPVWPRHTSSSFNGWQHGDIKSIGLPFVFSTFQSLLNSSLQ